MEERNEYRVAKQEEVLLQIVKALQGMEYGEILVKVQAGKVIVIDKVERIRIVPGSHEGKFWAVGKEKPTLVANLLDKCT